MRPAFILFTLVAFAFARPSEANVDSSDAALYSDLVSVFDNWDSLVEEAYQEWIDEQDSGAVAAATDLGVKSILKGVSAVKNTVLTHAATAAKAGLAAAKTAAKDGIKQATSAALAAAHGAVQSSIAGADAATDAAVAA